MDLHFNISLANAYKNRSQVARVLTENWLLENMYCPHCGNQKLTHFPNNRAVADFYCSQCGSEYELKSKNGQIRSKIADGAYDTFLQRITSSDNPDFFILGYDSESWSVKQLWIIPKYFFTPQVVERRKPLGANAKRAGWTGCNILLGEIPIQGRIAVIQNGAVRRKLEILKQINQAQVLHTENILERGWLFDVLNCINAIGEEEFSLQQMYQFEKVLEQKHPANLNVRPKIRQQLQILRDKGIIEFIARGVYRKTMSGC